MKFILEKGDLTWLQKNGYMGQEQVGIVWDQLAQKCNPVQEEGITTSQNISIKKELEIPNVEGIVLGEPKTNDICIAFSLKNGESLARSLQTRMIQKKKKVLLASESAVFDHHELEKRIASSTALIVLLTEECLKQVEVVFALHVAKFYYQHPSLVMLVHDAESCYFPSYDEQPESVRDFFSEKAITFLSCYPDEGVDEIVAKFNNEVHVLENILENFRQKPTDALFQFLAKNESRKEFSIQELRKRMKPFMNAEQLDEFEVMADKNKDGTLDADELQDVLTDMRKNAEAKEEEPVVATEEPSLEDLTTRVFLSHKRSTGQGIAGRFYEGLKKSYKVFIDSEAKFKIHNLKLIVQSTDVLVFILTYGILLSKWCLEELKSAIANKKKIIVVRELSFKYPDVLPDEWLEVEPVLRNSRELVWIAEYNSACVKALHNFIGSPDDRYRPAAKYFTTREGKITLHAIIGKFQSTKILDLNRTIPLPSTVEVDAALDFVLETIPANEITIAHITSTAEPNKSETILSGIFSRLPNIQELSLAGSGGIVTDAVVKELCARYPLLHKLDLEQCVELTSEACKSIKDLDHLTELNLGKICGLHDEAVERLTTGCPKLEVLKIEFAELTHKSFEYVNKIASLKELQFPYKLKNHEDAKKYLTEHPNVKVHMEPMLVDCKDYNGGWLPGIVKSYTATQTAIHLYGQPDYMDDILSKSQWPDRTAEFGSHKEEYTNVDVSHATSDCTMCECLHEQLRNTKFGGSPNKHFINDWYFQEQEGIDALKPYLEQAVAGQIQFSNYNLPTGIKVPTLLKAIFEKYPEETIKELYIDSSGPDEAATALQYLPHLKVFHYSGTITELTEITKIADALPATLEEFGWTGSISDQCAEYLSTKISNVTTFYLYTSYGDISEKALLGFFGENNKLQNVTIRNYNQISAETVKEMAQYCKNVTTLDLTLCEKLTKQADNVIVHLMKGFPSLKKLIIDLMILKSPKFEEFKAARPDVVAEFESIYLMDAQDYYGSSWYPAIQVSEKKGPSKTTTYHLYGVGRDSTFDPKNKDDEAKLKPLFTNKSNYGAQDYHSTMDCWHCNFLHPLCENVKFQGQSNKFFLNEWYFDGDEGKALLTKFVPHGAENRITFDVSLPEGIREWGVVKGLAKTADPEKSYTLNFISTTDITKLLEQPLKISGLEFEKDFYPQTDFLDVISTKQPKLTRLVIEQASLGSDWAKNWLNLNLPELQHLDVGGCKDIEDPVIDGIAKCTKLTFLSLAGTAVTDKSIDVLSKNWSNLTSLNLRNLDITEKSVEIVCRSCPNLQSLNLVLCSKVPATVCKLITEGFPKLKELKVPFHWINSEMLSQLKSARPDVTILERTELIDANNSTNWYPGVVLAETTKHCLVHFYGLDNSSDMWLQKDSPQVAPLFTNKEKYGKQAESHFSAVKCQYCEILHPMCEHFKFGPSKNLAFINDWFFDSHEGRVFMSQLATQVKSTNKLDLGIQFPAGVSFEKAAIAAMEAIPSDIITHISIPKSVSLEHLEQILNNKPNLISLSLMGAFTDEHATVIADTCQSFTTLILNFCDITDAGLLLSARMKIWDLSLSKIANRSPTKELNQ